MTRLTTGIALYFAAYLALHWASYVFVVADFRVTPWNPETGLSFLVAYLWGPITWPVILIASYAGEYMTSYSGDLGGTALRSALYATAYAAFGTIFKTWTSADRTGSLSQIVKFLVVSGLAALLFSGLIVSGISWFMRMPSSQILSGIITSATGDLIGIVSIVPLYIARRATGNANIFDKSVLLQIAIGLLLISIVCFVVFGLKSTDQFKFFYLVLLPVVAFSLLYGFVGAALSVFASDLFMMITIYGRDIAPGTVTELQIFMITLSATGLLLGSVVSERKRLSSELLQSHQRLNDAQGRLLHASRVMLINEMASAIAHEINQPLSAIRNYCRTIQRLLPRTNISSERLSALVGAAVEQVDVASDIINDTRRFVRREVPTAAQSSVAECVALCFKLLQQEIENRN